MFVYINEKTKNNFAFEQGANTVYVCYYIMSKWILSMCNDAGSGAYHEFAMRNKQQMDGRCVVCRTFLRKFLTRSINILIAFTFYNKDILQFLRWNISISPSTITDTENIFLLSMYRYSLVLLLFLFFHAINHLNYIISISIYRFVKSRCKL